MGAAQAAPASQRVGLHTLLQAERGLLMKRGLSLAAPVVPQRPTIALRRPPVPSVSGAYANDWARFASWCDDHDVPSIPADPRVVAWFLEAEAALGYSVMTIGHRLSAIGHVHRLRHVLPPLSHENAGVISEAMSRIRPVPGAHRARQATTRSLRIVLRTIADDTLRDARDRALLALRIAGALREAELARLSLDRITQDEDHIRIHVGRSSQAMTEQRDAIMIANDGVLRPVALLDHWIQQSGIQSGHVFRRLAGRRATEAPMTETDIVDVIRARASAAGLVYAMGPTGQGQCGDSP